MNTVNNKKDDNMKKILYTGASSGIAREVIKRIKHKYFIYVGVHTEKQLELQKEKYKKAKNIKVIKLDLLNNKDLEKIKKLDIDILISNAAIGHGGSLIEIPLNKIKQTYEVNVFKNIQLIQIVLKNMIKKGSGKIIIVSSLSGIIPPKFIGTYSSTKAALINISKVLKSELKLINKNIKVSLIEPGMYKTGFNEIMLEEKYEIKDTLFKNEFAKIRKKENIFWNLFQYKNKRGIVKQIIKSLEHDRFIYSAPKLQRMISKIYMLIKD